MRVQALPGGGFVLVPATDAADASSLARDAKDVARLQVSVDASGWRRPDGKRWRLRADASPPPAFSMLRQVVQAAFGIRVLPVTGAPSNGLAWRDLAVVDVGRLASSLMMLVGVTGHEVAHWLERNDSATAARLRETIAPYLTESGIDGQLAEENAGLLRGEAPVGRERAQSEVLANVNGAMWLDPAFWQRLTQIDNGSTMRKVLYQFMRVATRFIAVAKGAQFDVSRYVSDVAAVREAAAQAWAQRAQRPGMAAGKAVGVQAARRTGRRGGMIGVQEMGGAGGAPTWAVTRKTPNAGVQHLGYYSSQADAERAADIERNRVNREAGRKGGQWWVDQNASDDNAVVIAPQGRGSQLDAVGRARAVEATLAARPNAIKTLAEGAALKQVPMNAGDCFGLATEGSLAGLGDYVAGMATGKDGPVWHAVIMREGAVYDPTFQRWFEPGIYEALGFEPRRTLTAAEIRQQVEETNAIVTPYTLGMTGPDGEPKLSRRARDTSTPDLFNSTPDLFAGLVPQEPAQRQKPATAAAPAEDFSLTAPTRADVLAQQDARDREARDEVARRAARDEAERQQRAQADIRSRQDASAENFQLGQDAGDALAGQGGLFGSRAKPEAEPDLTDRLVDVPVLVQSTGEQARLTVDGGRYLADLRRRVATLERVADCVG